MVLLRSTGYCFHTYTFTLSAFCLACSSERHGLRFIHTQHCRPDLYSRPKQTGRTGQLIISSHLISSHLISIMQLLRIDATADDFVLVPAGGPHFFFLLNGHFYSPAQLNQRVYPHFSATFWRPRGHRCLRFCPAQVFCRIMTILCTHDELQCDTAAA